MDANAAIGYLAIIAGVLALLVGILGCFTGYCKNPCTSCIFCIVALAVGILSLIAGGIVMTLDWDEIQVQACNTGNQEVFNGQTGYTYMKQQYGSMVDDNLCTTQCPCDNTVADVTFLNGMSNLGDYGSAGRQAQGGAAVGPIELVFGNPGDAATVTSYQECYDNYIYSN